MADFGFAAPTMGKDGTGYLKTYLGTFSYMAPEIILSSPYEGKKVDIFSAGIILFVLVNGLQPFGHASRAKDKYYKMLTSNTPEKFWEFHSKSNNKIELSADLVSLL